MGHSRRRIGVRAAAATAECESCLAAAHLFPAVGRSGFLSADRAGVYDASPLPSAEADLRADPAPGAALDVVRRGVCQGGTAGTPPGATPCRPVVRIPYRRRQYV